jgi:subtilisin family serine protease
MRNLVRSLAAIVALGLAFAGVSAARSHAEAIPATPVIARERQLLVMLRLGPQHFRPETSYGGSYGDGAGRSARWREAARVARDQGAVLVDEWPMPSLGVDCFVMGVPEGRPFEEVVARIAHDPSVSWSEPMHTYHGQGEPASYNDPLYRVQPAAREWDLADLHRISTGRNVRVAVVDSMVDAAHPDLKGQVELVQNFVTGRPTAPEAHGTGVAGIIAARADNGIGIAGVAPQAKVLGLRACWEETKPAAGSTTVCDTLSLAKALDFAIERKAQVINMSLSGPPDLLLGRLLDVALAHDIAVVAAYDRNAASGGFPASHHGVTAVVDEGGPTLPGVVAAPGRDVPTTEPGGRWFLVNGSSYAAAHVSGLLALVRQRTPFTHGAPMLVMARYNDMVDACATLLQKSGPCDCSCAHPNEVSSIAAK